MSVRKSNKIIYIVFFVSLTSVGLIAFLPLNNINYHSWFKSSPEPPVNIIPNNNDVQINKTITDFSYQRDYSVKINEVNNSLIENDLKNHTQEIFFTQDSSQATHKFIDTDKNILSGSSFSIEDQKIIITIYIDPNFNQENTLFEINRNYLTGLLQAVESTKQSETYNPQYQEINSLVHQIMMELGETKQYPIVILNK